MHFLIDILPVIVLMMLFWESNYNKEFNGSFLAKDVSNSWKGILAIIVLLHHISQRLSGDYLLFSVFYDAGFIAVAAFFFFSGYGLQKQRLNKGVEYRKDYFKKRVFTILIPFGIVVVLQWFNNRAMGNYYPIKAVLNAMFVGDQPLMVMYSWYVVVILAFYIIFGLLLYIIPKDNRKVITCVIGINILYVLFCIWKGIGTYWFNAVHLLWIGMLAAQYEQVLIEWFKKRYILCLIISILVFLVSYVLIRGKILDFTDTYMGDMIIKSICAVAFVTLILLSNLKLKIGNCILSFLGKISFEIYLMQGIFISGLSHHISFANEVLWAYGIIVSTIIGAIFLFYVNKIIRKIL